MKPVFAHIKSTSAYWNIGDEASCPQQYFSEYADCAVVGFDDVRDLPPGQPVILGGGGILAFPKFIRVTAQRRPTIIFGAGLNNPPGFDEQEVGEALSHCALVGVRDRRFAERHGFEYVPCASAAHPAFRAGLTPLRNTLSYQHAWHDQPPGSEISISNMDRERSVDYTIRIICASETIITNSYHGALWAALAGRRCILWRAHDLRFFSGLPYIPPIVHTEEELQIALDFVPKPPRVYDDCAGRVYNFRYDVNKLLKTL